METAGHGFLWTSAYPEELEFWTWWRLNDMKLKGTSSLTAWQGECPCLPQGQAEHAQCEAASTTSRLMAKAWVELERGTLQSDTQQLPPLELHISSPLQLAPADSCKLHSGNVENVFLKNYYYFNLESSCK